jgi:hydrogenase-1 operon protein HyaE
MTIPMPLALGADARAHPLIAQLFSKHGYAEVTADNFAAFTARPGRTLLFFVEDPMRYRETLDLAVIVPELMRTFPDRFDVGVLLPAAARQFHARYGFRRWPAFVVLADGQYVGAVDGLREWSDYAQEIERLSTAPPTRPPTLGIAVAGAPREAS